MAAARTPLALLALAVVSVLVRSTELDVGYWIDEGLSVGIADRPLLDVPGTLRQDGSPPLYYMLLNLWLELTGDPGEESTHLLSLILATAAIPTTWVLTDRLFGARAAWGAAILVALNPFLTTYAQETRMYALVVLLGVPAVLCFVAAFAMRRGRPWLIGFVASYAALLYTHNWALFLGGALAIAWAALVAIEPDRRPLVRDGLLAAGGVLVLFAPWIPSLVFQVEHTGAPWARAPNSDVLRAAPEFLLGEIESYLLLLAAGIGLAGLWRARPREWTPEARAALVLVVAGLGTLVLAWLSSQVTPAWAVRYLAVALAPLLLASAVGLARAGTLGLAGLALVAVLWVGDRGPEEKSNAREITAALAPALHPGDLLVVTQPEQVPVVHHYLRDVEGLRYATLTGPVADIGVTDWRDGVERLEAATPERNLAPLLDDVPEGGRAVLLTPEFYNLDRWKAPWTALVRRRSTAWEAFVRSDPRFRVVTVEPDPPLPSHPNPLRATVLVRTGVR